MSRNDQSGLLSAPDSNWLDLFSTGVSSILLNDRPKLKAFRELLAEVCELPADWNSYGAQQINQSAANFALKLFEQITYDETPLPQLIPLASGAVQLEWHLAGIDLELEVNKAGNLDIYFEDSTTEQLEEQSFPFEQGKFLAKRYVQSLTERVVPHPYAVA